MPRSIFAKSSTLSINRPSRTLSRQMISAYSVACSELFVRPFASISPNIEMIDSGVFSSCDTFEMKSLLSSFERRSRRIAIARNARPATITVTASPIARESTIRLRRIS